MEWSSLISAIVGGLIVILTQAVTHWLTRSSAAADKRDAADERIATLALEVVNWFEIDTHDVIDAAGGPMPAIRQGHPIYSLAAMIRKNRPDIQENAAQILTLFRDYYQVSRILLPRAAPEEKADLADRITNPANKIMGHLSLIVEAVCDQKKPDQARKDGA